MAKHISTGRMGEQLALHYLKNLGYKILHQNWKYQHWEVDIIAEKENVLHFIEVKTRKSLRFGYPENDVSKKKLRHIIDAAAEYQEQYPGWVRIQFDVLSITLSEGKADYFFIEDVYI